MSAIADNEADAARYEAGRRRRARWFLLLTATLFVGIVVAVLRLSRPQQPDGDKLLHEARAAFETGDYETARRQANSVLKREPDNAVALLLVGKCLEAGGSMEAAVETFGKIPAGSPPHSTEAAWRRGHLLLLRLHRPSEAETSYLRARKDDPFSVEANKGLTVLWGFSGQWWRQIPPRLAMFRGGQTERVHLFSMALAETSLDMSLDVQRLLRETPDDPLVLLAAARLAVEAREFSTAIAMLRRAIRTSPDLVQAHMRLGEIHFERGDAAKFQAWNRNLPNSADGHPTTWLLRGKWARRHSSPEQALRCFCEAVARDPNQSDALYQAGRILNELKRPEDAAPFLARAKALQEFLNAAKAANSDDDLNATQRVARLAETLGNTWEAFGWASLAAGHSTKPDWATRMVARLKPRLAKLRLERTGPEFNPVKTLDYQSLPLPSGMALKPGAIAKASNKKATGRFSFEDRAKAAGIAFQYFNGSTDVANGTKYMYEVMGGGVAVLDINGDLRPDLYFTQGCRWPVDESRFDHLDRVYLNAGNGRFVDVTEASGIRENRFGQGVTVGDFNSDGFPDLLVANIGRNRLYRNNGDGTFSDIGAAAGFARSDWSTSCAIADLTGDGHPEIYVVNYLAGSDVFTRTCGPNNDGVCLPQHFAAAADRLFWNAGDGNFRDVTATSGISGGEGKGLGIVVATFGEAKRPNVFIANDTVANFYFENLSTADANPPTFHDRALLRGLALSDNGQAQACMGVAAGDADGDGEIDLIVTNFHGESNAYYQYAGGSFRDRAMTRGLRQPSLLKLGFGTQFLDADLDGWLDLLVANGHIDNFSRDGRTEYQMQPQLFANRGRGRFREVDAKSAGRYFRKKSLGRSVARLDWNGDGREDAVVLHLDAPVALLTNTGTAGGFLEVHLRGVASSRDAIGAVVRVKTKDRLLTRQLTAGDGFHASNERILTFGLGTAENVESLSIRWPSGRREEFGTLPANTRWMIVEGQGRLYSVSLR